MKFKKVVMFSLSFAFLATLSFLFVSSAQKTNKVEAAEFVNGITMNYPRASEASVRPGDSIRIQCNATAGPTWVMYKADFSGQDSSNQTTFFGSENANLTNGELPLQELRVNIPSNASIGTYTVGCSANFYSTVPLPEGANPYPQALAYVNLNVSSGPVTSDTTPPTVTITSPSPTNGQVFPANTASTSFNLTTNENATCRWSQNSSQSTYASMPTSNTFSATQGGTVHTTSLALSNGQSYTTYVACADVATPPNASFSQSRNFSVANATTGPDTTPPAVPQNFTVTFPTIGEFPQPSSSLQLNWSLLSTSDVERVEVYRSSPGGSTVLPTPISTLTGSAKNGPNYVALGLLQNRTYKFQLKAYDTAGNSSVTSLVSKTTTRVGPPTSVQVSATTNNVYMTWTMSTTPGVQYGVYTNINPDGTPNSSWVQSSPQVIDPTPLNANTLSYVFSGLTPSSLYKFRLIAIDDANNLSTFATKQVSTLQGTSTDTTAPTPGALTVTGTTQSSVSLSWPASSDPSSPVSYKLYRSTSNSSITPANSTFTTLLTSQAGTTYTDGPNPSLTAGTKYWYKLVACDSVPNCSVLNSYTAVSGTTSNAPDTTPPNVPTALTVNGATANSLNISWNASTDQGGGSVSGYKLYRSTSNSTSQSAPADNTFTILVASPTSTTYTDGPSPSLTSGTKYWYKIAACDNATPTNNCSAQSSAQSGVTLSAPGTPLNAAVVTQTTSAITISWAAGNPANATVYKIYRLNSAGTAIDTSVTPILVPVPNLSYTIDQNLNPGTTYKFLVTASNSIGESSTSVPSGDTTTDNKVSGTTSTAQLSISSLQLVKPDGTVIQNLASGPAIQIDIGSNNMAEGASIKANTTPTTVGSVKFSMTGGGYTTQNPYEAIENVSPYTLFGDSGEQNINAWTNIPIGIYTLTVTPYSSQAAGGQVGVPMSVTFEIVDNTDNTAPLNPTNVDVKYRSDQQIKLNWVNSTSSDTSYYKIYRNSDVNSIGVKTHPLASGDYFIDSSVDGTSSYTYKVTAVDSSGNEAALPSTGITPQPLSTSFAMNNPVRVNVASAQVRSTPESAPTGTKYSGYTGTVANGPVWFKSGSTLVNYRYVDFSGNPSGDDVDGWINETQIVLNVTTDTTAPVTSITAPANNATVSGPVTITATATDAVGVTQVQFFEGTTLLGTTTTSPYSIVWDTAPVPNGVKSLTAKASDAAGNVGTSAARSVTVNNTVVDTTPPTPVPVLSVTGSPTINSVSLNWPDSTDPSGPIRYKLFRTTAGGPFEEFNLSFQEVPGVNAPSSVTDTSLQPLTAYSYRVQACDGATPSNCTGFSNVISFTTPEDVTPPSSTTCSAPPISGSYTGQNLSVQLCAEVSNNPDRITLKWSDVPGRTISSISVYRKTGYNSTSWTQMSPSPSSSAINWVDSSASAGQYYEYKVSMSTNFGTATGYIASGINLPQQASKGKLILVIDNTFQTSLAAQIVTLTNELIADRWVVIPKYVSRTDTPVSVRNQIKAEYDADPTNVKAVYLLGHVPVASIGNFNQDGHGSRAFSSDTYYGEMTSTWSSGNCSPFTFNPQGLSVVFDINNHDNDITETVETPPTTSRFCNSSTPSAVELEVGRVDMHSLTRIYSSSSEATLLSNYLAKVTQFKKKQFTPTERAFVRDINGQNPWGGFTWTGGKSIWGTMPSIVGINNITKDNNDTQSEANKMHVILNNNSYMFAYALWGGDNVSESTHGLSGSATGSGTNQWGGVFNITAGSYYGEWNASNSLLRSMLASGKAMTSMYGADRHWYLHSMSMGQNIGYAAKTSINNTTSLYTPVGGYWDNSYGGNAYMTMLGDPTLKMRYVAPVSSLAVTNLSGNTSLSWPAASSATSGYNVYKITSNAITRLNASPVTGTVFNPASEPFVNGSKYMVTAVKLETTPSGSYYNESLGAIQTASGGGVTTDTTPPVTSITAPANNATISGQVQITANASDNTAVTSVDFLLNGAVIGTSSNAPYQLLWDTTSVANGTKSLTTKAYDAAGNVGTSAARSVTVNNVIISPTAPVLTISANGVDPVVMSWTPLTNGTGTVTYKLERKTGAGAWEQFQDPFPTQTVYTAASPFTDSSTHDQGILYTYRLQACDSASTPNCLYSNEAPVTPNLVVAQGMTVVINSPVSGASLSAGTTSTPVTITTTAAATCRWSNTNQTFAQMTSTLSGSGTSHTGNFTGLADGQNYTKYVACSETSTGIAPAAVGVSFYVQSAGGSGQMMGLRNQPVGPILTTNPTTCTASGGGGVYYVDSNAGDDSKNGTSPTTAWKTLAKVESFGYSMPSGSTICLKRGSTFRETLSFTRPATSGSPFKFDAYGSGAAPLITGYDQIASTGWTQHSGNIWKKNISTNLTPRKLKVGGLEQKLARHPNTGWLQTDNMYGNSVFDSWIATQPANSLVGANIIVKQLPWAWNGQTITSQSGNQVSFQNGTVYGSSTMEGWPYGVENKLSFLDSAGEWYYNPTSGDLYLWAPGNVNPSTLNIELMVRSRGIFIDQQRSDLQFRNLKFEGFTESINGDPYQSNMVYENLEMADAYDGIRAYIPATGTQYGNIVFRNNHIHDTWNYGISIIGDAPGVVIDGNIIEDIGLDAWTGYHWQYWGLIGISTTNSPNVTITRNIVRNTGYVGMFPNGSGLIEENLVESSLSLLTDGSGIMFNQSNGFTIRKNIVKDIIHGIVDMPVPYYGYTEKENGIYFGNYDIKDTTVEKNTISNVGTTGLVFDHGPRNTNNKMLNNTVFDYKAAGIFYTDYSMYDETQHPVNSGGGAWYCYPFENTLPTCFKADAGDTVTGNKFYSEVPEAYPIKVDYVYNRITNGVKSYMDFGNLNNNHYFHPNNPKLARLNFPLLSQYFQQYPGPYPYDPQPLTMAQWRAFQTQRDDVNSTETITPGATAQIFINPSPSSITQAVNGCTSAGTPLTGNQTILPFESLVVEYGSC